MVLFISSSSSSTPPQSPSIDIRTCEFEIIDLNNSVGVHLSHRKYSRLAKTRTPINVNNIIVTLLPYATT